MFERILLGIVLTVVGLAVSILLGIILTIITLMVSE